MDPLTQGLLGGAAAQALCGRALPRSAWLIGVAAGMAADLDICIRPAADPLGGLTYHRHFTHALALIPVGALVTALPFVFWRAYRGKRLWVLLAALAAYATHGLLDACTSYGTVLFWPFTDARVAWDFISIIDPLFTLILFAGLLWATVARSRRVAAGAVALAALYMSFGAVQHARAARVQARMAEARGHAIERGRVLPTLGNNVLWRSVYVADGRIYTDAVRVPPFGVSAVQLGTSAALVTRETLAAGGAGRGDLAAFERFAWFADGYTAFDERDPHVIADVRYGVQADRITSFWGLRLPAAKTETAARLVRLGGVRPATRAEFWAALWGRDPRFRPLPAAPAAQR